MDLNIRRSAKVHTVAVCGSDRWQVYYRLQELQVPAECALNQPLQIPLSSVVAAIQLWSVVRQITASRNEGVEWLERCWALSYNMHQP